jgi:hypothetical protein
VLAWKRDREVGSGIERERGEKEWRGGGRNLEVRTKVKVNCSQPQ